MGGTRRKASEKAGGRVLSSGRNNASSGSGREISAKRIRARMRVMREQPTPGQLFMCRSPQMIRSIMQHSRCAISVRLVHCPKGEVIPRIAANSRLDSVVVHQAEDFAAGAGILLEAPRRAEVTMSDPGFRIPRIVMQPWEAWSTTATPSGLRLFMRKSAICPSAAPEPGAGGRTCPRSAPAC